MSNFEKQLKTIREAFKRPSRNQIVKKITDDLDIAELTRLNSNFDTAVTELLDFIKENESKIKRIIEYDQDGDFFYHGTDTFDEALRPIEEHQTDLVRLLYEFENFYNIMKAKAENN